LIPSTVDVVQEQNERPKLVARVIPRRRLDMTSDEEAHKVARAALLRAREWWAASSSDSDWLNTDDVLDSDTNDTAPPAAVLLPDADVVVGGGAAAGVVGREASMSPGSRRFHSASVSEAGLREEDSQCSLKR
jgi:hypothetical protein